MTQGLSGPGLGLPLPQYLYPTELAGAPYDAASNHVGLAPGDEIPIPAGNWYISLGMYCTLEFLDPVTGTWRMGPTGGWAGGMRFIKSDGFTTRIANRTGCPVSATITADGTGWVQSTTTITAVGSTSTWLPVVGGKLGASVADPGAGYGIAPIVLISAPPPAASNPNGVGGVQATGFAVITNGTVSAFSFTNPGAGYPTAPTAVVLPNPTDPNISTGITAASISFSLVGAGSLSAALCTNPGAPITPSAITLTLGGAGSAATLTANVLQTVTAGSVIGTGLGYGTVAALLTTVGGSPAAGSITNGPDNLGLSWRPRPAQIGLAVTNGGTLAGQVGTIYDGGLFLSAPTAVIVTNPLPGGNVTISGATLALVMGSRPDFVTMQPAP